MHSSNPTDPGARGLPAPDPAARAHSARLEAQIRSQMEAAGGRLPFDRFMDLALYAPGLGYYVAGSRKLGAEGDFVTAPELSPLFGACLARPCAQVLAELGGGDILELGAGSGALAVSLLEALAEVGSLPGRYLILEPSPELQERQREAVAGLDPALGARVQWLQELPRRLRGLVLANEVLDAMPVHRFQIWDGAIMEVYVSWDAEGFREWVGPPESPGLVAAVAELQAAGLAVDEGYGSELNLRLGPWLAALGQGLEAGALLLIDYGYPRPVYYLAERSMGTLMCHYRHRAHPDPYVLVGLQDITAHVDFSAQAGAGRAADLELLGYSTQAHFLLGCGLDELLSRTLTQDPFSRMRQLQQAKQLILPDAMGERFQAMALGRGLQQPLPGFQLRDLRGRL
jgi:SAM-dependent MidA family methyltransferase